MKRLFTNPITLIFLLFLAYQSITSGRYASPMAWLMSTLMTLPGIVIALSFHEFAHAIVADRCGDPTPRAQGRVTINPFAHIDPIGFIALIFIGFGWGKPVMINPNNFKKRRYYELLVSVAGVVMNLLLAILFMGILRLLYQVQATFMVSSMGQIVSDIFVQIVLINIMLMVFNLLPVPPLDGFGIITQLFNLEGTRFYYEVYNKGMLILMALILFNVTGMILTPCINFVFNGLRLLFFS